MTTPSTPARSSTTRWRSSSGPKRSGPSRCWPATGAASTPWPAPSSMRRPSTVRPWAAWSIRPTADPCTSTVSRPCRRFSWPPSTVRPAPTMSTARPRTPNGAESPVLTVPTVGPRAVPRSVRHRAEGLHGPKSPTPTVRSPPPPTPATRAAPPAVTEGSARHPGPRHRRPLGIGPRPRHRRPPLQRPATGPSRPPGHRHRLPRRGRRHPPRRHGMSGRFGPVSGHLKAGVASLAPQCRPVDRAERPLIPVRWWRPRRRVSPCTNR